MAAPGEKSRLFIGRIPQSVTDDQLRNHFSQYGDVTDVYLPRSNEGKKSKIAFVTFPKKSQMYKALSEDRHVLGGEELNVVEAQPKVGGSSPDGATDSVRLFIGNIPLNTTDDELRDYFGNFGQVTDVYRPGKSKEKVRGYGFVTFVDSRGVYGALASPSHLFKGDTELNVVAAKAKAQRPRPGVPPAGPRGPPLQQQPFARGPPRQQSVSLYSAADGWGMEPKGAPQAASAWGAYGGAGGAAGMNAAAYGGYDAYGYSGYGLDQLGGPRGGGRASKQDHRYAPY